MDDEDIDASEEFREYLNNDNVEELVDMIEVIFAILKFKGVDVKVFESIRAKKAEERGSFDKRLFLKEVLKE